MAAGPNDAPAGALEELHLLGERLTRAREALKIAPFGGDEPVDGDGNPLARALEAANAAVASLGDFVVGPRRSYAGGAIALTRRGPAVAVAVLGAPSSTDVAAFVDELRRLDQRLLDSAELLGLLVGLTAKWASAGFAPPVVTQTLTEYAPRIVELGATLGGPGPGSAAEG